MTMQVYRGLLDDMSTSNLAFVGDSRRQHTVVMTMLAAREGRPLLPRMC